MKNSKRIFPFLLLWCMSSSCLLHGKRRKKIIPRFNPVPAHSDNEIIPEEQEITPLPLLNKEPIPEKELLNPIIEEELPLIEEEEEVVEQKTPEEPASAPEKKELGDIFLNFENADLSAFVDYIGNLTKINVITDPKIAGKKISLTIRKPLTVDAASKLFHTILEMSGFSMVKVGDVHKVIPQKGKLNEPLPAYFINTPAEDLPDSDLTIRYVTLLNNIPIAQARPLLQSMLSPTSKVISYRNANGFVITDKSYNIKAAMKVIQELDRSDVKQSVTVMRLKQANADDVKKLFDGLMRKPAQSPIARLLGRSDTSVEYFPPTTKIITEPRTNSLILLGDQKSIKRIEDFIINHVDKSLKGVKSPIHVYELQHTDVEQIKEILEAITASGSSSPAAKHGGVRGGVKYFKKMKFAMDKQNNRLLVSSSNTQDWKLLKKTLKDIDKPQAQVILETFIVSVDFSKNKELSSQFRNKVPGHLGRNLDAQAANMTNIITSEADRSLAGNLLEAAIGGLGSTVLTFGNAAKDNIWGIIRMLQSQVNLTVIQQPFLTTTNMKKASIMIGETRRVVYQQAIAELSGDAGSAQGFEDAEAKLTLIVTPQINLEGIITLDIDLNITEFTDLTGNRPDTTVKRLKTKVSMADGQILVLGGFVKTKVTESIFRTPLLSRIPIIGWLFKGKTRSITKEYIFVFMSPTIMKPRSLPGTNLYTKMKLHRAKEDIDSAIEVKIGKDPIHNWFFNPEGETYSHKVVDFANARYQPISVDIANDPFYRTKTERAAKIEETIEQKEEKQPPQGEEKKLPFIDTPPNNGEQQQKEDKSSQDEEEEELPSIDDPVIYTPLKNEEGERDDKPLAKNDKRARLKQLLATHYASGNQGHSS